MTITLTVEEVKNYVSAMEHWQIRRAIAVQAVVTQQLTKGFDYRTADRPLVEPAIREKMSAWEQANPMPTLLSSHFGALVPKVTEQQKPIMNKG